MNDLTFRQCHLCGYESDDLSEFVKGPDVKYGRKNLCKWCANHNIVRINARIAKKEPKLAILREAKSKPCADCGKTYPICVMDFHHLDPSKKEIKVGEAAGTNISMEKFLEELSKCVILCANCHRLRHG